MLKKSKSKSTENTTDVPPVKKIKKSLTIQEPNQDKSEIKKSKLIKKEKGTKSDKPVSTFKSKKGLNTTTGKPKFKSFSKDGKQLLEKPADWNEFKKKKKEVHVKRKQNRNLYDVIIKAKALGENLRKKKLKENLQEREKLTEELHSLLGNQNNYSKFVLTHDMARIVQYMLKLSSEKIRSEIAQELIPSTIEMLQSKYAKFCVKQMLKYGNAKTRSGVIKAFYGRAVKLASHSLSCVIFDYAYTTWASVKEKQHLVQEFYGDMYKQSKDDSLTHVRDAYKNTPEMKTAVLGAMKANLARIMNKELLDSHCVQTVISQYLEECSEEDRAELISQLSSHIVVLSNSKEGATAAMLCYRHGTNKDRKTIMKSLKEHILNMCKHEHAHTTIIAILDSVDDTVLLNKMLLGDIITHAAELVKNEWGRRVLLWLIAPADPVHFHPKLVKELNQARENSVSKKDVTIRRSEILGYCVDKLLGYISADTKLWMENASVAIVTFTILKAGTGDNLSTAYENISHIITDRDWKIAEKEKEIVGIEHPGFHMLLKKLLKHDYTSEVKLFAPALVEALSEKTIKKWIKSETACNRACFFLVHIIENSSEETCDNLKKKFGEKNITLLNEKQAKFKGASILLQKIT